MRQDRQLAEQIRDGSPGAWTAFVDLFGPRLHHLARRYAACDADAEDLTQEIFVALFQGMANFRGDSSLATWSYRVTLNHCLKYAARVHPLTVPYEAAPEEPEPAERGPVRQVVSRELAGQVQTALEHLSPDHREIVILHELHDLTYAECAAVLGVPVGTIKSRLSYAFRHLRVALTGYVLSDTLPESAL